MKERERVKISTGYQPNELQKEIHMNLRRFNVIVCHRRFGKTVVAINALTDSAARCTKINGRFAYIAPFRKQAKDIAWDYLKRYAGSLPGAKINESELRVDLPNGARITLYGADDPDSFRGLYFDGVVMDEVAQMKGTVWGEVVRPALSDRKGWVIFIGTPKGINLFYKLYHENLTRPDWFVRTYPIAATLHKLAWLDEEEVKAAREAVSEAQARQEWDCDWNASNDDVIIPVDLVRESAGRFVKEDDFIHAPVVIGVDVARFGDDRSVIATRQGLYMHPLQIFKGVDNTYLADKVMATVNKYKADAVFVDHGQGGGVVDICRRLNYVVHEVPFGGKARDQNHYHDRRTEMWFDLAKWMKSGGVIPGDSDCAADLVVPTYAYDDRGRVIMESKKSMKSRVGWSPDVGDAFALTLAMPVRARAGVVFGPDGAIIAGNASLTHTNDNYDPFR